MSKNPIIITPKGTLKYPRLFVADTKFKAEGEYKTSLILTPEEAAPLIKQLKAIHAESYAVECAAKKKKALKQADWPFKKETDKDGDETGNVEFKASLRAKVAPVGKEAWEQRPAVIDAKKQPVPASVNIGNGTTAKLKLEVSPWFNDAKGFGLSLRLKAVQIIDLVEYTGGDATEGFDEEEGYAAATTAAGSDEDFDEVPVADEKPKAGGKAKSKTADF